MMFQNLALYPDKTVFDNIAYPLRERKLPKAEIQTAGARRSPRALYIDHLLAAQAGQAERRRAPARGHRAAPWCASRAPR